jgi:hypothetical protein
MRMKARFSRTRQACYRAGLAVGEFRRELYMAFHRADQGDITSARRILKLAQIQTTYHLENAGIINKNEGSALRAKLEKALSQKTASMVERKTKYLMRDELEDVEKRAKKTCLGPLGR